MAYRPPAPTVIDLRAQWLAAMRSASNLVICTGAAWCAGALAAPFALHWHARNVLRQARSEELLDTVVDAHIAPLYAGFILVALIAAGTVTAGIRIRRLRPRALLAAVAACSVLGADMVRRMLANPDDDPAFRLAAVGWLAYVAWVACKASWQKRGEPVASV